MNKLLIGLAIVLGAGVAYAMPSAQPLTQSQIKTPQDVQPALGVNVYQSALNSVQRTQDGQELQPAQEGRELQTTVDIYQLQGR